MLDPNYNLTILEHTLRERQYQLQKDMETDWQFQTLLAERLGALDRLRLRIGQALIAAGLRLEGRLAQSLPSQPSVHPR